MPVTLPADLAAAILREVIVGLVRRDGPALSSHQLGVFLTCYSVDGEHTVRGLAQRLDVSKSVITRSLDKLAGLGLAERAPDLRDRRSVLVARTATGEALMREITGAAVQSAAGWQE